MCKHFQISTLFNERTLTLHLMSLRSLNKTIITACFSHVYYFKIMFGSGSFIHSNSIYCVGMLHTRHHTWKLEPQKNEIQGTKSYRMASNFKSFDTLNLKCNKQQLLRLS